MKQVEVPVPPFDGDVRPGDVRIFADRDEPFVALVLDARGLLGWRIVPVSPDPVPVSWREIAMGRRVYELWNACTAARGFVLRSWLVDRLAEADVERVRDALAAARPGRLFAGDGRAALRERERFAMGGTFRPLLASLEEDGGLSGENPFVPRDAPRLWWKEALKVAASVVVCLGTFYLLLGPGVKGVRALHAKFYPVRMADSDEAIELADLPPEDTAPSGEERNAFAEELALDSYVPDGLPPVPEFQYCGRVVPPVAPRLSPLAARRLAAMRIRPVRVTPGPGFLDPREMPRSVLETGASESLASGGASVLDTDRECPKVEALVAACPWDPRSMLLNVKAEGVAPGSVEVLFAPGKVRGYRLLSGGDTRPLNAFYEVCLAGPDSISEGFCRVLARSSSRSEGGRVEVPVRSVEVEDMGDVRVPHSRALKTEGGSGGFASPNDVPVEIVE